MYQVRENEADRIASALESGKTQCLRKAEGFTNELWGKLQQLLKECQETVLAYRKDFYNSVQPLVCQDVVLTRQEEFQEKMEKRITEIPQVSFRFEGDLIPCVPKIEHCNLIVFIEPLIHQSITALCGRYRDYQKKALAALKEELSLDDALSQQAEDSLKSQLDSAQKELLVCQGNYELHRAMILGLVESTEYFRTQCNGQGKENPSASAAQNEETEEMMEG